MTSSYEPPALFVNWQGESSRRIFPVGRLVTLKGEGYEFAYIAAAREAQEFGFAPFQAFPDLERVYRAPRVAFLASATFLAMNGSPVPESSDWEVVILSVADSTKAART